MESRDASHARSPQAPIILILPCPFCRNSFEDKSLAIAVGAVSFGSARGTYSANSTTRRECLDKLVLLGENHLPLRTASLAPLANNLAHSRAQQTAGAGGHNRRRR
jgi:hypothetical protein